MKYIVGIKRVDGLSFLRIVDEKVSLTGFYLCSKFDTREEVSSASCYIQDLLELSRFQFCSFFFLEERLIEKDGEAYTCLVYGIGPSY